MAAREKMRTEGLYIDPKNHIPPSLANYIFPLHAIRPNLLLTHCIYLPFLLQFPLCLCLCSFLLHFSLFSL
jgi:hypothetical protein